MAVTAARSTQADIHQDETFRPISGIQRAGRADTFQVSGGKVAVVKNAISWNLPAQVFI